MENDKLAVHFSFAKMVQRSDKREAKLLVIIFQNWIIDAKLLAFSFASLRLFSEVEVNS